MKSHGIEWETRIYTDYIDDMDSELGRVMEIPEAAAFFQGWQTKLNDMIHYADGETWTLA